MANIVTTRILEDGVRNAVIHAYIASDGASGDETDTVLVDVSTLAGAPSAVSVLKVTGNFAGFTGVLEWDATADVPFLAVPDSSEFEFDGCEFAGITNNAGAGVTGDITITTTGLGTAGDAGHLTFWVRKS